jgi:hypothetical protein
MSLHPVLPIELTCHILSFVPVEQLGRICRTSKGLKETATWALCKRMGTWCQEMETQVLTSLDKMETQVLTSLDKMETRVLTSLDKKERTSVANDLQAIRAKLVTTDDFRAFPRRLVERLITLPLDKQLPLENTLVFPQMRWNFAQVGRLFSACLDAQAAPQRITEKSKEQNLATLTLLSSNQFHDLTSLVVKEVKKLNGGGLMRSGAFIHLASFCLANGDLKGAQVLCHSSDSDEQDREIRAILDPYFSSPDPEIERVGMKRLLDFAAFLQERGFRQNYLVSGAAYYMRKNQFAKAFEALERTGKRVDDKLNQLLMQKPELLECAHQFALSIQEPQLRLHCVRLCTSRKRTSSEYPLCLERKRSRSALPGAFQDTNALSS